MRKRPLRRVLPILAAWVLAGCGPTPPTTTLTPPTTTTTTPTTTTPTATTTPTTTTPTTTTTTIPPQTIIDFVGEFRSALDSNDLDFLFGRLHPAVKEGWGEDLCRAWVDRDVARLDEYQLTGEPSEAVDTTITTPAGDLPIEGFVSVPIRFVFQGETVDAEGGFARLDGQVYWIGECR